jgi:hypothetical protein
MKKLKEDLIYFVEIVVVFIITIWIFSIFGLGLTLQMIPTLGYWPTIMVLTIDMILLTIYLYKKYGKTNREI